MLKTTVIAKMYANCVVNETARCQSCK